MNPWKLYDELISQIPEDITVVCCNAGHNWTTLLSSEGMAGVAKTIPVFASRIAIRGK